MGVIANSFSHVDEYGEAPTSSPMIRAMCSKIDHICTRPDRNIPLPVEICLEVLQQIEHITVEHLYTLMSERLARERVTDGYVHDSRAYLVIIALLLERDLTVEEIETLTNYKSATVLAILSAIRVSLQDISCASVHERGKKIRVQYTGN